MLCSISNIFISNDPFSVKNIFVYPSLFEQELQYNNMHPANITYLNNYSNEISGGYYRLDNIKSGNKISMPPNPERNGFNFTGWFTETECLTRWDFDQAIEIAENAEFMLYAGWQQK